MADEQRAKKAGHVYVEHVCNAAQERQIRPVFANTEIFGAVFRRVHSKKAKYMPPDSYLAAPKFVFDVPALGFGHSWFRA